MPKYKNNSNKILSINSVTFLPNEEKEVDFFIKLINYPELELIDSNLVFKPVVFSQVCGAGTIFDITNNKSDSSTLIRVISNSTEPASISFEEDGPQVVVTTYPLELRPIKNFDKIYVKSGSVSIEIWESILWR